jgi:hypothetical protein
MADSLPRLQLGDANSDPGDMMRLIAVACAAYAVRDTRKAADALCAAETAARQQNLNREAAKIRKAIAILAQGGKPRLLTRPGYLDGPH